MNSLPVLLMSKESKGREHVAKQTINALCKHLKYDGQYCFYGAIVGSLDYVNQLAGVMNKQHQRWYCFHFNEDVTPGYAWNTVLSAILENHDIYLRMEDDFVLKGDLDIDPYIELMRTKQEVGMVRLGLMPKHLRLYSEGWFDSAGQGHIFFDCLPETQYAYSGNPGLVHKRLHDAAGMFHEEKNPGDIEIDFDKKVRDKMNEGGPRIWWPLDLGKFGTYGAWNHLGEVKSY